MNAICIEYAWNLHGILMECACDMCGISMAYALHMHGVCTKYEWDVHGMCMECA